MAQIDFPEKMQFLFQPHRYKVLYGGRGGAKSWGIARALLLTAATRTIRVLCAREIQKSLEESVHKLLKDQIVALGLGDQFEVTQSKIRHVGNAYNPGNGSEFSFEGIRYNVDKIKSYEGVDICWVEEAHQTSKSSWDVLIPTIRKSGSEIWISFNPQLETDETYKRFVKNVPPNAKAVMMNWRDNPWFPEELRQEMEYLKSTNYDDYLWIWEGQCRVMLDGAVYAKEFRDARANGRIRKVPYDPALAVHVFVDLGWADSTALWFAQRGVMECRFINYYHDRGQKWEFYMKYIRSQGYNIDTIWLPHDARQRHIATGTSVWELTKAGGFKRRLVPRLKLFDGINAARTLFPIAYFDEIQCADGLKALMHYKYDVDNEDKDNPVYSKEPVHDWSSHGADGFRYAAIGMRGRVVGTLQPGDEVELEPDQPKIVQENWGNPPRAFGPTGTRWMA